MRNKFSDFNLVDMKLHLGPTKLPNFLAIIIIMICILQYAYYHNTVELNYKQMSALAKIHLCMDWDGGRNLHVTHLRVTPIIWIFPAHLSSSFVNSFLKLSRGDPRYWYIIIIMGWPSSPHIKHEVTVPV